MEQTDANPPKFTLDPQIEHLGAMIVDSIVYVHERLGPGLLESIYEVCLFRTLLKRGVKVERQVSVPVVFDGETLDANLRLDLLVGDQVVIELKAVEQILPIHHAQVITYLKLFGKRLGFSRKFQHQEYSTWDQEGCALMFSDFVAPEGGIVVNRLCCGRGGEDACS